MIRAAQAGTVPAHLACGLCERLVQDAVTITCCDVPFCDACVRKVVTATGTCPSCQKEGVLCDDLEPDEDALKRAYNTHALVYWPSTTGSAAALEPHDEFRYDYGVVFVPGTGAGAGPAFRHRPAGNKYPGPIDVQTFHPEHEV